MPTSIVLPAFAPDQPAARVDAALREALSACDRARECAVLWFGKVQRRALYREFGCASLEICATASLGFSQNRDWQFKRRADDLERLPVLKEAVATGELGWTKAQQVARVATPETQQAWVERAVTTGRRELAREVQAARAVVMAEALAAMVEGEPAPAESPAAAAARPGVQVVVQQCPDCAAATVATSRGEAPLAPAQVAALACDAVVRAPARGGVNRSTIPPPVRAEVLARDRYRCSQPGCGATRFLEVHHLVPRVKGGGKLVTLCSR